jgi:EAL domain-containing protein (putative c-di-GMP-specific phosphodiesterase class I)
MMYSAAMNDIAQEQLKLNTAARRAVDNNEFTVAYQPQVDVSSGKLIGAEALARWTHPEMGLISPDIFIPLTESNETISILGSWVAQQACEQAECWRHNIIPTFRIGVNVSAKQFQDPSLIDMIDQVLTNTKLPAENLEIEITEGMIMEDIDKAIRTLLNIKERGVKIAIDDFGTGYSSLSQLKNFPVDRLKIDQSFVADIENDINNRIIIEMISGLAAKMNIEVIAEGIETEEQKQFLLSVGCSQMQGFLFSPAITAKEFNKFANTHSCDDLF